MSVFHPLDYYQKVADFIKNKIGFVPEIAVILGTGSGSFADRINNPVVLDYKDIPGFLVTTNPSHAGKIIAGTLGEKKILCMSGRFHYYEGYDFEDLKLPVYVLKLLGIQKLIITNASGAVNLSYKPGDVMIISDHIKLYEGSPMRGKNSDEMGPRFFAVTDMYTKQLRQKALECAKLSKNKNLRIHEGVYMFFPGPQFETPAEIRAARLLGADAVGMSTVTEALTAAHCSMPLLGLCLMTNMAAGIEATSTETGEEVDRVAAQMAPVFCDYLEDVVLSL